MTTVTFEIPGQVVPWQRTGGGARRFTPQRTRAYQAVVAHLGMFARPRGWPLEQARYSLSATFHMGDLRCRDIDNCLKTLSDALNGIMWRDDGYVDELHGYRKLDRENPRTVVTIEILE